MLRRLCDDSAALAVALVIAVTLSCYTYKLRDTWPGIPPAPTTSSALSYGFGDVQFSYRAIGLMLQNAGDTGGRVTNFRDYNYERLRDWLDLTYKLDPRANYMPNLAAYYYSASKKPEDIAKLVDYLALVARDTFDGQPERWRWLAQAVYLARFKMNDQDKALLLAKELAALPSPDMPVWTRQMPAFVMTKVGQKKAARDLLLTIAATDKSLQQADINQTCWYINAHLREPDDGLDQNVIFQALCGKIAL